MSKKRISVIHGPNLNLLGSREPEHYGKMTLDDINASLKNRAKAIRDSLVAKNVKFIEVHLSNVFAREDFRKNSFFSDVAIGIISGLGAEGYIAALNFINQTK